MPADLIAIESRLWAAADHLWANTGLKRARAGVMQAVRMELRRLPAPFTKDVRAEKMARAYAHVYDHYLGAGSSAF